ncbi:hypothetical protein BDV06DRAFT_217363 [Aspergillus oleicola]
MSADLKDNIPASVKVIWEETITQFHQQTGQRLDGTLRGVDDLKKSVNTLYDAQTDSKDVAKAKEVGLQVINCIQLLGGIAAEGASIAFGPAGLCFNALSFLLDIPKKVHEYHGEVTAIFEEVGPVLSQFRVYQRVEESTQIDEALRDCIHQVMTRFVDLCAYCIKIHRESGWRSFKRTTKRVLLDDKSVKDQLDHFKELIQNQSNIQATLTIEAALETRQYTSLTMSLAKEINANATETKAGVSELVYGEHNLTKVKDKLALKDEKIKPFVETLSNNWEGSLEDSFKWLHDVEIYKQWLDGSSTADSLLMITGAAGTGKSFLISAIAHEIKSIQGPKRTLTGYYSFSVAAKDDKVRKRPEAAVKSICVQMAEKNETYAKSVAAVVLETKKDEKHFRDAEYSVNLLGDEEFERLMQTVEKLTALNSEDGKSNGVRVLLCVDSSHKSNLKLRYASAKSLDITQHNMGDIDLFIAKELRNVFSEQDDDSQRRRKKIQARVLERLTNSYTRAQQDLAKIKEIIDSSGTEEDLNKVLQGSTSDPKTRVQSDITALEAVLKPKEVEEINELLIWVIAGFTWFDLKELTSALFLHFNAISVQSLAQKVTEKYSKIFALSSSGDSLFPQDFVEDCVLTDRVEPRQPKDTPKIDVTISITNADTRGFDFGPDSMLHKSAKRRIHIYRVDAHYDIVQRAVDLFLRSSVDERAKGMGTYLMAYMPVHLKELRQATGCDQPLLSEKQYIASHICDMFNDGYFIEKNWEFCEWVQWYKDDNQISIFWTWLDDPDAIAHLRPKEKRWLASKAKAANRNQSLLIDIMTVVARNWLQESKWEPLEAFKWINGFLSLDTDEEAPKDSASGDEVEELEEGAQDDENSGGLSYDSDNYSIDMVLAAEKWCEDVLNTTLLTYNRHKRLALTYEKIGETEAAFQQYEKAVALLEGQDPVNKEQLQDALHALGTLSCSPGTALQYFEKAYRQNERNVETLFSLLESYITGGRENEAEDIVRKAVFEKNSDTGLTLLTPLLNLTIDNHNDNVTMAVVRAVFSLTVSDAAIEMARTESKYEYLALLHLGLGITINHIRKEYPEDLDKGEAHLHQCLETLRENPSVEAQKQWKRWMVQDHALSYLSMCWFNKAIRANGIGLEYYEKELRNTHETNKQFSNVMYVLGSFYTFAGQRDRADDLLRSEMTTTFNILFDNEIGNDIDGFYTLRHLFTSVGDYDNARRASLLIPFWRFDEEVLTELFSDEDPSFDPVTSQLVEFYQREIPSGNIGHSQLSGLLAEAKRLSTEAESGGDSEEIAAWDKACTVLSKYTWISEGSDPSFRCANCRRGFKYDMKVHHCKYCYNMDFCDDCWRVLKSGERGKVLVCSKLHDWWDFGPWTSKYYVRAWNRLIPVTDENGNEVLVTLSQWLEGVCEEWGLSKSNWNFE